MGNTETPSRHAYLSQLPSASAVRTRSGLARRLPWLIVVVLVAVAAFMFVQYRDARAKLAAANTPAAVNSQVSGLLSRLGKIMVLPENETPTVATVLHADKLKDQTFFAQARDGDKVVVYSKEKEAILYRPSTNQIVTVSGVNVSTGSGNLKADK